MQNKIGGPVNKGLNDFKASNDPESKNFKNLIAFIIIVVTLSIGVAGAVLYFFAPEWSKVFNELFGELWPVMVTVTTAYFGFDYLKAGLAYLKGGKNANK